MYHRVRAEERLSQIAALHGFAVADLVRANPHKPLARLQSGAVVFASLAAGEDLALPAMLGEAPTQDAIDACSSSGGVAQFVVPDPNTADQPYSWQATCTNGTSCTGGAERTTDCQSCPANAYASGSECLCYEGYAPLTVPVFSMSGGGGWGGGIPIVTNVLTACLLPSPSGPNVGDACTDADGYAGTYTQATPPSGDGFPGSALVCSQGPQQNAYAGDSCTTPEGQAGEYDSYLTCVAYPPKVGDACVAAQGLMGKLAEGPAPAWGGPPTLVCVAHGTFAVGPQAGDACTDAAGKAGTYDAFMDCVTAPPGVRHINKSLFLRPGAMFQTPGDAGQGDACTTATGHAGKINAQLLCVANAQDQTKPGDPCTSNGVAGRLDQNLQCVTPTVEATPPKPKPGAPCTTKQGQHGVRNAQLLCVAKTITGQQAGETTPAVEESSKLPWILGGIAIVAAVAGGVYIYKGGEKPGATKPGAKPAKGKSGAKQAG